MELSDETMKGANRIERIDAFFSKDAWGGHQETSIDTEAKAAVCNEQ